MLYDILLCYIMLYYVILCYIILLAYSYIMYPNLDLNPRKLAPPQPFSSQPQGFGVLQALEDRRFSSGTSEQLGRGRIQSRL